MKKQILSKVPHQVVRKTTFAGGYPVGGPAWNVGSEPWPEPVQGRELLHDIAQVFARFVVLPEWGPELLALWALHTYAFHLRDLTTYLGIVGRTKRCGQARLSTVLGALVNRPVTASQVRTVPLLRLIDENRLTLLVDTEEALAKGTEDLREILNSGHTRSTAFIAKVTSPTTQSATGFSEACPAWNDSGPASWPPVFSAGLVLFSSWCPKAMATVGTLPSGFAERCVTLQLRRKRSREGCQRLRNLGHLTSPLRRKSSRFVLDHAEAIREGAFTAPLGLNPPTAETWGPLFVLADVAGGRWPEVSRAAARAFSPGSK